MLYRSQVEGQPLDRFSLADATSVAAAGAASPEAQAPNAWFPGHPPPSTPAPSFSTPSAAGQAEDAEEHMRQQQLDAAALEVGDHARRTEAYAMVAQAQASLSAAKVPLRPPLAVRARALQLQRRSPCLLEPSGQLAEPPLRTQSVFPLCTCARST